MNKPVDIFISFKTNTINNRSLLIAQDLYKQLSRLKFNVFFSERTIEQQSDSDFNKVIDSALNEAKIFILVATEKEYLNEGYVYHEWSVFQTMIKSGLKKDGRMFIVYESISIPQDLPPSLINCQSYNMGNIDHLYNQLKTNDVKEDEAFDLYKYSKANIEKNDKGYTFLRKSLDNSVTNFLVSDKKCCFIFGDPNSGASSFLLLLSKKFVNSKALLYTSDIQEAYHHLVNNPSNNSKIKYAFIDDVDTEEEFVCLFELIKLLDNAKIVVPICNFFRNTLVSRINNFFSFQIVKVERLSNDDISLILREKLTTEQANKIIYFINKFNLDFLYSFKTIIALNKYVLFENVDLDNIDLIDVLCRIDNSGDLEKEQKKQLFNYVLNNHDSKFGNLVDEMNLNELVLNGYLIKTASGCVPVSKDLFSFEFVKYLFEQNLEEKADNEVISLYKIKGFYLAFLYKFNREKYVEFDVSTMSSSDIFKFLNSVIIKPDDLNEIASNKAIANYFLDYISFKIDSGKLDFAEKAIAVLAQYRFCGITDSDLEALNLWLLYKKSEKFTINDAYLTNKRYAFYCAEIYYFSDDYKSSKKCFTKALNARQTNSFSDMNIYFPYFELLIDIGNVKLIKKIIRKIEKETLSRHHEALIENIKGYISMCEGNFSDAINSYEKGVSIVEKTSYDYVLTKFHGDLSYVYFLIGDYEKALYYNNLNLEFCKTKINYNGLTVSHEIRGCIDLMKGDLLSAFKYFNIGLMYSRYSNNNWRNIILRLYASIIPYSWKNLDNYDFANIVSDIESIDSDDFKSTAYSLLCLSYYSRNDIESAKKYISACKAALVSCNEEEMKKVIRNLELVLDGKPLPSIKSNNFSSRIFSVVEEIRKANTIDDRVVPFKEFDLNGLYLTKMLPFNAVDIFEYSSDEENTQYMIWNTHQSYFDTLSYIDSVLKREISDNYICWGIELNNKIIGCIDMSFNEQFECYEIGYILNKNYWRQGIMFSAAIKVLKYMKSWGIKRIVGVAFKENVASRKTLEKCGFKFSHEMEENGVTQFVYFLDLENKNFEDQ